MAMMTKEDVVRDFNAHVRPRIIERFGKNDKAALRTAWNDYTDMLCKDGKITEYQYENWTNPF